MCRPHNPVWEACQAATWVHGAGVQGPQPRAAGHDRHQENHAGLNPSLQVKAPQPRAYLIERLNKSSSRRGLPSSNLQFTYTSSYCRISPCTWNM